MPKSINSPMPGKIAEIRVKEGDKITRGSVTLILESMKMLNEISSEFRGTVESINVNVGDFVKTDEALINLT